LKKFLCPENTPYGYTTLSQQDAVIFKLGEILLMYAEAQNEISGPDASVYRATTDFHARVGMPPYPAGLSKEQMRERIRHERRIALAFKWDDKFSRWPLPQEEIDKSNGTLTQNAAN
jgi:hypothetical protein